VREDAVLKRFASATAVAALVIAFLSGVLFIVSRPAPGWSLEEFAPVIALWCLVPALWGLWAMLTPRAWFPERLPLWGAILGCILGVFGALVLNIPLRMFGVDLPVVYRVIAVGVAMVNYSGFWTGVRGVYLRLTRTA